MTINLGGKRRKELQAWVTAYEKREAIGQATGSPGTPFLIKIPNAKLWSPGRPHLYRLGVALANGEKRLDTAYSYFAMRKISIGKDRDGIPRAPTVVKMTEGCEELAAAAVDAVMRWRYEPAKRNGQPVPVYFTVTVQFRLE